MVHSYQVALLALLVLLPPGTAQDRSRTQVERFKRLTGYPQGREGYVVDHLIPLACGGPDHPLNMQWQPIAEAKAKDRVELECGRYCPPFNQRVK